MAKNKGAETAETGTENPETQGQTDVTETVETETVETESGQTESGELVEASEIDVEAKTKSERVQALPRVITGEEIVTMAVALCKGRAAKETDHDIFLNVGMRMTDKELKELRKTHNEMRNDPEHPERKRFVPEMPEPVKKRGSNINFASVGLQTAIAEAFAKRAEQIAQAAEAAK